MKRERLVKNENGDFVWVPIERAVNHDERKIYSTRFGVPEKSVAAGCHSNQVEDFNNYYRERGVVGARHLPDGTLEYESQGSFNKVLELRGLFDRDACYGQYAGKESD
jgi:hypothetical protein